MSKTKVKTRAYRYTCEQCGRGKLQPGLRHGTGRRFCDACKRDRENAAQRRKRRVRKRAGVCAQCARAVCVDSVVYCRRHLRDATRRRTTNMDLQHRRVRCGKCGQVTR